MLTFEKMLFLKSLAFFKFIKPEVLLTIASAMQEQVLKKGETLIRKGNIEDTMYIIVSGVLKVHDEDRELAKIGEREIVGELAALVPDRRIASVTAVEDCFVFKINHSTLYYLMETNIELVKGVVEGLVQKLRGLYRS